jgi:hypothetical protein
VGLSVRTHSAVLTTPKWAHRKAGTMAGQWLRPSTYSWGGAMGNNSKTTPAFLSTSLPGSKLNAFEGLSQNPYLRPIVSPILQVKILGRGKYKVKRPR